MNNIPEAAVAVCKCGRSHKLFGVRFEKKSSGTWEYTWAFPLKADAAKREGYDGTRIDGAIEPDLDYPGCPYCGSIGFVLCGCGNLNCNIPNSSTFTCEWCGRSGELEAWGNGGFNAGGDR